MNVIVAIGGGIAAYKTLSFIRLLRKSKHQVKVIMTQSASQFVTPTSITALSENPVYTDLWSAPETLESQEQHNMHHITLAKWADVIIIAPATANRISILARGSCEDLLSNVIMASAAPVAIAPAMNKYMWENPATQSNIELLKKRNITIWGPDWGMQACGDEGEGRLLEPDKLMTHFEQWVRPFHLSFSRLLISAGATQEPIDPVRYISNYSSGKMAFALAELAHQYGIEVTIVHAQVDPILLNELSVGIKCVATQTAQDMLVALNEQLQQGKKANSPFEVFIACAAVADYRPKQFSTQKIKKNKANLLTLELVKNPDILQEIAVNRESSLPFCAGFALESENLKENATNKLKEKKIDMIFANPITSLNAHSSSITALWQSDNHIKSHQFPHLRKSENAQHILKLISEKFTLSYSQPTT